jgi:hypothetical protein
MQQLQVLAAEFYNTDCGNKKSFAKSLSGKHLQANSSELCYLSACD